MIDFKLIYIFLFILVLSSCSHHIKVSPRKCLAPKARWSLRTDGDQFRYRTYIRTDNQFTKIRTILDERKRSCENLRHINLVHKYTWKDVFWNLLPFVGRCTLIVSGSSSTSE